MTKSNPRSEKIECPRCWKQMDQVKKDRVEIDVCPECKGIWLDTRELLKLTDEKALHEFLTRYAELEGDSELVCPRCGGLMNAETAKGVEVDVCTTCKGVWLDAGELEAISAERELGTIGKHKEQDLQEKKAGQSLLNKLVEWAHYK